MPNFTETPICKTHQNCVACRNDQRFRDHMKSQYGDWECPLGIPVDTKLENMPQEIQAAEAQRQEMVKQAQQRQDNMRSSIDTIEKALIQNLKQIGTLRANIFPDTKTPETCISCPGANGETDETCCGGTIKKVTSYLCFKKTTTTKTKCMQCADYEHKLQI